MSQIVDEIRAAYKPLGIEVEGVATYGTYYRLRCGRCGAIVGSIGERLLPGMARQVVELQADLYSSALMGCKCGYQIERVRLSAQPRNRAETPS